MQENVAAAACVSNVRVHTHSWARVGCKARATTAEEKIKFYAGANSIVGDVLD